MTRINPRVFRSLCVAAAFVVVGTARVARAQDDHEPDESAGADAAALDRFVAIKLQRQALILERAEQQHRRSRDEIKGRLDALLSSRLTVLKHRCRLSEAQLRKLAVAGQFDIRRLMDESDKTAHLAQRAIVQPHDAVRVWVLGVAVGDDPTEDSFGEGSLFFKTLRHTLGREQVQRYEQACAEKVRLRYQGALERGANSMRRILDLSRAQVEALVELVVRETRPPKRYGYAQASDLDLFLVQMARLPDETVRPLLNDTQWRRLCQWTAEFNDSAGGADHLRRIGFIFDDAPSERKSVPETETKPKQPEE
jgi:hypothetical protein